MTETTGRFSSTIHRLLEFDPVEKNFKHNDMNPLEGDLLVVDEFSMVDVPLFSRLLQAIPSGMQVVIVGDVDQLPSVGPGSCLKDLIDSKRIPCFRLGTVHRQAETSKIVVNANLINEGNIDLDLSVPSQFSFMECSTEKIPSLVEKLVVRALELEGGDVFNVQVLTPFRKKKAGISSRELNRNLQKVLNPPSEAKSEYVSGSRIFREGDKVIQMTNNYEKGVFNGDLGLVVSCNADDGVVTVQYDTVESGVVEYDSAELDELELAYAVTIHKSQGSEYGFVIVPVSMQNKVMLARNLIYTAVTRGKKAVVLVGERPALEYAIKNSQKQHRNTALKWLLTK
jgi:exodeoxyribonuclease V alpha subunit